jgi:hypothetical protein
MAVRIFATALLAVSVSTAALAQSTGGAGGAGSAGGAAGGAPGAAPAGTAGVSPSAAAPAVGTPGIPGPASGAGLPGGPGPGNTALAPNQAPAASPAPSVGTGTGNRSAGAVGGLNANSGRNTGRVNPLASATRQSSKRDPDFHPEAVTDKALGEAASEITTMPPSELRQLNTLFDACTVNQHPMLRQGKCAAATKLYKSSFGRDRATDRALAELARVVRFQHMFRTGGARSSDYEDNINKRLRGSTALALAATGQSAKVSLIYKDRARH